MATVLLTRPEGENDGLARLLEEQGVKVFTRPLIELSGIGVSPEAKQLMMDIDHQDVVIFISKSAVRFALPELGVYWPQWPVAPRWLAVGAGTAAALSGHGIVADYPAVAGSEGLLELPGLQAVNGSKVLIVRGRGGRELIASELTRRGADVTYLEVYQRSPTPAGDWLDLAPGSVVVVTSLEALASLRAKLGDRTSECRLVVAAPRIAAETEGFAQTVIAAGASDQALYDAILRCL